MSDITPQDRQPEEPLTQLPSASNEQVAPSSSVPMRIGDAERSEAVQRVQQAMATGHLEFDETGDRFETIYKAQTVKDLEVAVADLPPGPTAAPSHPARSLDVKLMGDNKKAGMGDVGAGYTSVTLLGDTQLDLTSLDLSTGRAKVTCWSLAGDVKVIVPDGVRVQRGGVCIAGDEKERLVPPVAGSPLIEVEIFQLFGDCKIYSLSLLPENRLRKWWRSVRSGN